MPNLKLLNNIDHADLRVVVGHGAALGDAVNQVLVFPTEFQNVQREYPILFRRDDGGAFQSVALLGLDRGENLFLDDYGWNARYVPAIQSRGPFFIGVQRREGDDAADDAEPMIHVDLDHPRIGKSEGEPVFLPHGGNSPYLEYVAGVLRTIHEGMRMSGPMFAAFEEAGLLEPVQLEIKLNDAEQYKLPDFYTIGAQRLATLDGERLERLNRAGFLPAAIFACASLENISRLIELKNRKAAAAEQERG